MLESAPHQRAGQKYYAHSLSLPPHNWVLSMPMSYPVYSVWTQLLPTHRLWPQGSLAWWWSLCAGHQNSAVSNNRPSLAPSILPAPVSFPEVTCHTGGVTHSNFIWGSWEKWACPMAVNTIFSPTIHFYISIPWLSLWMNLIPLPMGKCFNHYLYKCTKQM